MRILIRLKSLVNAKYDNSLSYYFHSFFKQHALSGYHNTDSVRFYNFSSIFPYGDMNFGDERSIVFSSPDKDIISAILLLLQKFSMSNHIELSSNYKFQLVNFTVKRNNISGCDTLACSTPIVLKTFDGKYWGAEHGSDDKFTFLDLLERNLNNTYNTFHNRKNLTKLKDCFDKMEFMRTTAVSIKDNMVIIGSKWFFVVKKDISFDALKFLEFNAECGFGQKTGMGFGHMRILGG